MHVYAIINLYVCIGPFGVSSELEALGDDLALDEDTSYLDEVPAPSDTIPGERDTGGARTQVHNS